MTERNKTRDERGWSDPKVLGPIIAAILTTILTAAIPILMGAQSQPQSQQQAIQQQAIQQQASNPTTTTTTINPATTNPQLRISNTPIIQQYDDPPNDTLMVSYYLLNEKFYGGKSDESYITAGCSKDVFIPDIIGTDYRINGEILKDTIWLQNPLIDPSINYNTNVTIKRVDVTKPDQASSLKNSSISINSTKIIPSNVDYNPIINRTVSGYHATIYNYTNKEGSVMIVEKKFPVFYIIKFTTNATLFEYYWPEVKKMMDSFDLAYSQINAKENEFLVYNDTFLGIVMRYPKNWQHVAINEHPYIVKFVPDSLWSKIHFTMTIFTRSNVTYNNAHLNYKVSDEWDWKSNKWTRIVDEISPFQPDRELQLGVKNIERNTINTGFISNNKSYVDLSFNLSSIGLPKDYLVTSAVELDFYRNGMPCKARDITSGVPIPPPHIDISIFPKSITLRPGEMKSFLINLSSYSNFPSKILLNTSADRDQDLDLSVSQNEIFLPPYGVFNSNLRIKASSNTSSIGYFTLPITGYTYSDGEIVSSSSRLLYDNEIINTTIPTVYANIIVLPPLSFADHLNKFLNDYVNISGIVTTIMVIITTFITYIVWYRYARARKKNKRSQKSRNIDY